MSTPATLKPGNQPWRIYDIERENARVIGDPPRTVVEGLMKLAAEEEAATRPSFNEYGRIPLQATELRPAQWLPKHRPRHQSEFAQTISPHPKEGWIRA